jgi:hypothetical protein
VGKELVGKELVGKELVGKELVGKELARRPNGRARRTSTWSWQKARRNRGG